MAEMKVSSFNLNVARTKTMKMNSHKAVNFGRSTLVAGSSGHLSSTTPLSINGKSIINKIKQFFNLPKPKIKNVVTRIANPDGSANIITRSAEGKLLKIKELDISHNPIVEKTFENGKLKSVSSLKKQEKAVSGDIIESLNSAGNKVRTTFDNEGYEHSIENFSKEGKLTSKFNFENGVHATVYSDKEKSVGEINFYVDRKNPNSISLLDSKGNKTAKVYYEHGEIPVRIDKYNEIGLVSEQTDFEKGKPVSRILFYDDLIQQEPSQPVGEEVNHILTKAKQLLNKALA